MKMANVSWNLVYSPKNQYFEDLLTNASRSFRPRLGGVIGVKGQNELEAAMVANPSVAGVQFEHPAVNKYILLINFSKHLI